MFTISMIQAILPEVLLVLLGAVILLLDLVLSEDHKGSLGWVSAGGLLVIIIISLLAARPESPGSHVWGGMIRFDWLAFAFKLLVMFSAAVTSLFIINYEDLGRRGEFYVLLLASTLGMSFMAASANLIMLFLAIEMTSIPLYVLAGFMTDNDNSTEAGFKYLLFGAMTSAVMLYGFSLLYGYTGTADIYRIAQVIAQLLEARQIAGITLISFIILILVGFGFKISVVPFHFWAPDVYQGAPTPITGFLSTASKAAGFAVLMRVLIIAFPVFAAQWGAIAAALAVATMTLGNLLALAQRNIKRMLAYSSIAHAGYAMIGVVSLSTLGITSVVFYLIVYAITNLAAFGVVTVAGRVLGSDEIADYAGLSRRAPGLALAMMVAFLSLAGMPPLGGFVIKVFVFAAAVDSELIWLAVVGVINSIIGLYYYLTVLKVVYLYRSENDEQPLAVPAPYAFGLWVLTIGIILVGTLFAPWFTWASTAALAMF